MLTEQSYDMMLANLERSIRLDEPIIVNDRIQFVPDSYERTMTGQLRRVWGLKQRACVVVSQDRRSVRVVTQLPGHHGEPDERTHTVRSIDVVEGEYHA